MTNKQKELAGKYYLIADLYSHGYDARIVSRTSRPGTDILVNEQTTIRVLTRFVNPDESYNYLFGDEAPQDETPLYAFVTVFPVQGVPHHEVYIVPSNWVITRSIQLHDDYIRNNPNVNKKQPYTLSPEDLQPFQNNWTAINSATTNI
jgi:hypothetical protein